jgi:hypothetical protein
MLLEGRDVKLPHVLGRQAAEGWQGYHVQWGPRAYFNRQWTAAYDIHFHFYSSRSWQVYIRNITNIKLIIITP